MDGPQTPSTSIDDMRIWDLQQKNKNLEEELFKLKTQHEEVVKKLTMERDNINIERQQENEANETLVEKLEESLKEAQQKLDQMEKEMHEQKEKWKVCIYGLIECTFCFF